MKLRIKTNSGSALILVSLGTAVIIGLALTYSLSAVSNERMTTVRSQAWNDALVTAEAGVEEGLSLANKYVGTSTAVTNWVNTAVSADGWSQSGNVFTLTRSLGKGFYTVNVTNISTNTVAVLAIGTVPGPDIWKQQSSNMISRSVLIISSNLSWFQGAILVKQTVKLSGSALVDSFNSQSSLYSNNGQYNASQAEAYGNIMSISTNVTGVVDMSGSSKIQGTVYMGAADTLTYSGGATVGNTNWVSGIEPGWVNNTANLSIPDAPAVPNVSWLPLPTETNNTYILNGGGLTAYYYAPASGLKLSGQNNIIVTNGTVYLYAEGNFEMSGSSQLIVAPNASLVCWFNGSVKLSGGGTVNQSGYAKNVTFYGTTNCTSFDYSGGSSFIGEIYAPEADITDSGNEETIGAIVGNSFTDNGGAALHYDQSLAGIGQGTYIATTWQEK